MPSAAAPVDYGKCHADRGRAAGKALVQEPTVGVGENVQILTGMPFLHPLVGTVEAPPHPDVSRLVCFSGATAAAETARATVAAAAAAATAVAAARAAKAETALTEALEAVEELEARCAAAQAKEAEVVRETNARIDELAGELEEANGHGSKVH